jgi:rubrerythrin
LAASSQSAEQKKMFDVLAVMEEGHKANLEGIYKNAAYAEVW